MSCLAVQACVPADSFLPWWFEPWVAALCNAMFFVQHCMVNHKGGLFLFFFFFFILTFIDNFHLNLAEECLATLCTNVSGALNHHDVSLAVCLVLKVVVSVCQRLLALHAREASRMESPALKYNNNKERVYIVKDFGRTHTAKKHKVKYKQDGIIPQQFEHRVLQWVDRSSCKANC